MTAISSEARRKRSEYTKHWKRNNPEKIKDHKKKAYLKNREFISTLKSEPCFDCGNKYEPCVMDFHHLDPSTKKGKYVLNAGWSKERMFESVKGCILLCANCHRLRTWGKSGTRTVRSAHCI